MSQTHNVYFAKFNSKQEFTQIGKGELIRELDFRGKHYFFIILEDGKKLYINDKWAINSSKYRSLVQKMEKAQEMEEAPKKVKSSKKGKKSQIEEEIPILEEQPLLEDFQE